MLKPVEREDENSPVLETIIVLPGVSVRARSVSAALLVSAALIAAPSATAFADGSADTGVTKSAAAKAKAQARKLEREANAKGAVVLGGTVVSVGDNPATTDVVETDSLSLTVHGGRYKPLRGQVVTVTVAPGAKVTKNEGVVTLADVVAGDHAVVKSRDFDFTVATTTDPVTSAVTATVTVTATVNRVAASPAEAPAA